MIRAYGVSLHQYAARSVLLPIESAFDALEIAPTVLGHIDQNIEGKTHPPRNVHGFCLLLARENHTHNNAPRDFRPAHALPPLAGQTQNRNHATSNREKELLPVILIFPP